MKIGIVVEGGGMKCAYCSGIMDEMLKDDVSFDYGIGVSAGSANLASFLAHQYGRNERFYEEYVKDPNFMGVSAFVRCGELFNLHYIYGDLTNTDGKDPLNFKRILNSNVEYYVVATNARTGNPAYFSKYDMKENDYRHIMASCAIPAACKPIKIGNDYYYDGGVSDSIPFKRAFADGCDKLVILAARERNYIAMPEKHRNIYTKACKKYPKIIEDLDMRHCMKNEQLIEMRKLEEEGKVFVFAPSKLVVSTSNQDPKLEHEQYEIGIKDYQDRKKEFIEFMKK